MFTLLRRLLLLGVPLVLLVLLIGCDALTGGSDSNSSKNPAWVNAMIARWKSQPVGNPPQSIYRYQYQGQTVYYVPAQCCDQFSALFDAQGTQICAPDGGLTGKGHGPCPDFFKQATGKELIWQDIR